MTDQILSAATDVTARNAPAENFVVELDADTAVSAQDMPPPNKLNDAAIIGEIEPDLLERQVQIAIGRNREDKNWQRPAPVTVRELLDVVTTFKRGPKDGVCIVQGAMVGPQRLAKNMSVNYLLMVDYDTGVPLDVVGQRISDTGLFAVLWTTHSHMKAESEVPESKLVLYQKRVGSAGPIDVGLVRDYLLDEKRYDAAVFAGIESVLTHAHKEGGVKYVITHNPMPRMRVLFLLDKPFQFAGRGGTQDQAITEWKERYAGFSVSLGLPYDRSCVDPSRLMYTPRIPLDATIGEGAHEIFVFGGRCLDFETVPRVNPREAANGVTRTIPSSISGDPLDAYLNLGGGAGGTGTTRVVEFKTSGLAKFLAKHARDFEAAEWLNAIAPDDVRRGDVGNGELDFRCHNEDGHTPTPGIDTGFHVVNASSNPDASGFKMWCMHDGCSSAAAGDRAWYLDGLCAHYGVSDAAELEDYCPALQEERARVAADAALAAKPDELGARIDALTPATDAAEITAVVRIIAALRSDKIAQGQYINRVAEKTDLGKRKISVAVQAAELQAIQTEAHEGAGHDIPIPPAHPLPAKEERATVIWDEWEVNDKKRIAARALAYRNDKKPRIFSRPEGGVVRLTDNPSGQPILDGVTTADTWKYLLGDTMQFKFTNLQTNREETCDPFNCCVIEVKEGDHKPYPVLDRIIYTPIFGPDGTLRLEKGYDAATQTYLSPNLDCIPLPEVVTAEHVDKALDLLLLGALRDFPFSDVFDGDETAPVKAPDVDEDGFRFPNLDRGVASRANALAMVLQPHMLAIIQGARPGYHIDKSVAGTGAGYLMDVVFMIAEGTTSVVRPMSQNQEEFRKNITAVLRSGAGIIFVDNIECDGELENGELAAALTAGTWSDRVLGATEIITIPNKALWAFAGNNLKFSRQLMRRMVPIRLDANVENPAHDRGRADFKHFPLQQWLKANRPELVWACQVLILNWIQKGMPKCERVGIMSFDDWSACMGGVLEAAGVPGFLENIPEYMAIRADGDDGIAKEVAQELWTVFGEREWTVSEAWEALKDQFGGVGANTLGTLRYAIPIKGDTEAARQNSLGRWLTNNLARHTFALEGKVTGDGGDGESVTRHPVKVAKRATKAGKKYRIHRILEGEVTE